jgi:hypothetical protein
LKGFTEKLAIYPLNSFVKEIIMKNIVNLSGANVKNGVAAANRFLMVLTGKFCRNVKRFVFRRNPF